MDREQDELQFLSLFGIYRESYKIVYKWRKIFSQITLTLILPLSFIFLADMEVSNILFFRIIHSESALDKTIPDTARYKRINDVLTKERATFWLFKAAYFTSMLIFSLLSTSAVVYTIACVYTAREITFRKIMSVVPRVWKRVMITFLCTVLAFLLYNIVAVVVGIVCLALLYSNSGDGGLAFFITFIFLLILYAIGFVYMTIIWQLASVVSVLEETKGIKAMIKSKKLLRGNMWVASIIFFKIVALAYVIQFSFQALVVDGWVFGIMGRIGFGVLLLLLLLKLILFLLVIQTVLYFVCKSYHHENIDKSALSYHLEVIYLGDYVPLKSKDVQLEQV
ncbi:hypothetical protein RchiOBHm_Chr6g0277711 [Rosa chinensis]|uniref:Polyadenylate-binding protein 1-B-binding protein n=1 Tax=Rosa chinensis TaxID=74649 RepID=A0A2P6PSM0_ROSCH|nr:uncharacterized protein LOC112171324 [Rosa chinensis]PRQ24914.1 hypothetical protein RchiOBHm_Chr6g0277711 [Rosa chinensis]